MVDKASWKRPAIFEWLQQQGAVEAEEMWQVFNCGVGFVLALPRLHVDAAMAELRRARLKPWQLGEVVKKGKSADVRFV